MTEKRLTGKTAYLDYCQNRDKIKQEIRDRKKPHKGLTITISPESVQKILENSEDVRYRVHLL